MIGTEVARRWAAAALVCGALMGCSDKARLAEQNARNELPAVLATAQANTSDVLEGLPKAAAAAAQSIYGHGDPRDRLAAVPQQLVHLQFNEPKLRDAKSTFFVLLDPRGLAIRSNQESDDFGGLELFAKAPSLRRDAGEVGTALWALDPKEPQFTLWLARAAVPGKATEQAAQGYLMTGWSLRHFAHHQTVQQRERTERLLAEARSTGRPPVQYVVLFDAERVYYPPSIPEAYEPVVERLGLHEKTAGDAASGVIEVGGRGLGWAAARLPVLGTEIGLALLRTEL